MFSLRRLNNLCFRLESEFVKDAFTMPLKLRAVSATTMAPKSGDMFSKEDSLPRLPVPELNLTMEKYMKSLEPITFESDLQETGQIVEEFSKPGGVGETLQAKLVEKANGSDNWLAEWWDNCAYYGYRDSVVVNSSPGVAFPHQTFFSEVDQFRFTAKLIHSVLKFKDLVDNHLIPVDYARKDPLTMVQYTKLLSMCRVPQAKCDKSVIATPEESRHVIVAHNNTFFSLKVYKDGTNVPLSEEELMQQLAFIVHASEEESECPVGILTSEGRNKWAQVYKRLMRDSRNKSNVEKIEKSICLICLDDPVDVPEVPGGGSGYEDVKMSVSVNQMLHGGGSTQNSANRWFDKPMQFIVNRNGFNGINYEHSGAEGPPVMALCNLVMKNSTFEHDYTNVVHVVNNKLSAPEELKWNLNYDMVDSIELAMDTIDEEAANLELRLFRFEDFGKNVPKKFKVSPDAFFQVCLQLAYWRLHSHHPPTYESASIRKFSRGRTEAIRSATPEVGRFAREMDRAKHDDNSKRDLFMKAIKAHVDYTVAAMDMKGVDRHMLGLKLTAIENGMPVPEIFRDKAYGYGAHFKLSTSQVASKYPACLCFGPVVPDGYGCCYNPMENSFLFSISAFRSHPKTQAGDLGEAMGKALKDVHLLLTSTSSKL